MRIVLLACIVLLAQCSLLVAQTVKVSVYYESLCPDSIAFINNQLHPTYLQIASSLVLDWVPYGKGSYTLNNGTYQFTCQHGPNECFGNWYQACALNQNNGQDKDEALVHCIMSQSNPADLTLMTNCASQVGVDWTPVEACVASGQGHQLLAAYGDRTHGLNPALTFVPTIIFNDVYNDIYQDGALTNFLFTACSLINGTKPPACPAASKVERDLTDFFGFWSL